MKVLILGGEGMLGRELVRFLNQQHEIYATTRARATENRSQSGHWHFNIDVRDAAAVQSVIDRVKPEVTINAVGVVKQLSDQVTAEEFIEVNALFPHRLARSCGQRDIRLIHISTDCVFSGVRGRYVETDVADPTDVYGMTKLLGEAPKHSVTLRCSMIGRERVRPGQRPRGLIGWFEMQSGEILGYSKAIFSGVTTREMARIVGRIIGSDQVSPGLWHVAAEPICKSDLLQRLVDRLPERGVSILPMPSPKIDRSLDGSLFAKVTGYQAPSWDIMLDELAADIRAASK